jgi:hypothetical protein
MDNNVVITESDRSLNYEEFYVKTEYDDDMRKDRSKSCYVCETSAIEYFFDCGNGLCLDCVREHLKAQLDKYKIKIFSKSVKFVCAGSCKCQAENEKMERLMDNETREIYEQVLLKMYLNQTKDIVSCPSSSCSFYGIVWNECKCHECNQCGHKWSSDENISNIYTLDNIKSIFKKYLITKKCNNCKAPIERNEGCVHMECNRCDYSFCWRCTEDWNGHSEYICMGLFANVWEESFRPDFSSYLYFLIFLAFIGKLIFTFTISFLLLYHILKIAVLFGMLLANVLITAWIVKLYKRFRTKVVFYNFILLVITEIILYASSLHPYSEKVYFYLQLGVYIPTIIRAISR